MNRETARPRRRRLTRPRLPLCPAQRRPTPPPAPLTPAQRIAVGRASMRPLNVPAGGIKLPVRGISFREDQYPDNVYRLLEVLNIAESLTEDRWAIKLLKRSDFRDTVSKVLTDGQLPVVLQRDYRNVHDPLAVMVWCPFLGDMGFLGYLPASGHLGRFLPGIAALLDAGRPNGHPPLKAWVSKVRAHPDYLDNPGIDITVRPWRPRPPGVPADHRRLVAVGR